MKTRVILEYDNFFVGVRDFPTNPFYMHWPIKMKPLNLRWPTTTFFLLNKPNETYINETLFLTSTRSAGIESKQCL